MSNNKINYRLLNVTLLMILLFIGFSNINLWIRIVAKIVSLLLPFIIGFVLAYAIHPLVQFLEKKGVRRWIALVAVILFLILAVVGLLIITLPMLYDQIGSFAKYIIELIEDIGTKFNLNLAGFEIKISDYFNDIIKYVGKLTFATFAAKIWTAITNSVQSLIDSRGQTNIASGGAWYTDLVNLIDSRITTKVKSEALNP